MFDFGFSEVLLIFVIALVVLGPEKLPRLASQVGRWVGRARAMARQFREQLEEEVNLEQVRKAHSAPPPQATTPESSPGASSEATPESSAGVTGTNSAASSESAPTPGAASAASSHTEPAATPQMPRPEDFRADTFSHAHPTNEYGANPLTPNGAAETVQPPPSLESSVETGSDESATQNPERPASGGAYPGSAATAAPVVEEPKH